jgi:ketosteroid isomerase-like protein
MRITRRMARFFPLFAFLSASLLAAQAPQESEGPDKAMMAPVTALASYMAHPDSAVMPSVFVNDGLVIVENFAPYIFRGKNAAADWNAAIRHDFRRVKDLKFAFGLAHDFDRNGDRVYFVLPTTWHGLRPEGRFEERGAWSFVLEDSSGQWRIISYTWGVTDETDTPTRSVGNVATTIRENEADGILAADAAWLKVYQAKDLDKSVAFCDEQGFMLAPNAPIAVGKDAIAKLIAEDFAHDNIEWHANKVGVSLSGDLGYTSGTTGMTFKDVSGKTVVYKGKYLTVWKKQANGEWKALYDMFNSDLPATP